MQGKSKHYFPNNLLLAALANILGRENPNIISPLFYAQAGFLVSGKWSNTNWRPTQENKYTAGHSGVMNNPSQQRYISSIGEMHAVVNLIYKNPRLKPGVFYYLAKYFLFPA